MKLNNDVKLVKNNVHVHQSIVRYSKYRPSVTDIQHMNSTAAGRNLSDFTVIR